MGRRRKKVHFWFPFKRTASGACSSKITMGDIFSVSLDMVLNGSSHFTFWNHRFFFVFFSDMVYDWHFFFFSVGLGDGQGALREGVNCYRVM